MDLTRAVDLTPLAKRDDHQHRWVYVVNFAVDDEVMAAMVKARTTGEGRVPLNLTNDNIIGQDGPGCLKCGIFWTAKEGYGRLCPVGDDEYLRRGEPVLTPEPHPKAANAPLQVQDPDVDDDAAALAEVMEGSFGIVGADGQVTRTLPTIG